MSAVSASETMIETIASPMGRSAETSVAEDEEQHDQRDGDADRLALREIGLARPC